MFYKFITNNQPAWYYTVYNIIISVNYDIDIYVLSFHFTVLYFINMMYDNNWKTLTNIFVYTYILLSIISISMLFGIYCFVYILPEQDTGISITDYVLFQNYVHNFNMYQFIHNISNYNNTFN